MRRFILFFILFAAGLSLYAQDAYYCTFDNGVLPANWTQSNVRASSGLSDWDFETAYSYCENGYIYSLGLADDTVNSFLVSPSFQLTSDNDYGHIIFRVSSLSLDEDENESTAHIKLCVLVDNDYIIEVGDYNIYSNVPYEVGDAITVRLGQALDLEEEPHTYNFVIYHIGQENADGACRIYNFGLVKNEGRLVVPNAGEGSGTMDFFSFEGSYTAPQSTFTPPTGKTFAFWAYYDMDIGANMGYDGTLYPQSKVEAGEEIYDYGWDFYLVAVYATPFTVNFRSNGGSGSMQPGTGVQYVRYVVPECEFYRRNNAFVGWNTQADGEGDWYWPGDEIDNTDYDGNIIATTITLYAQWEVMDPLVLSFDANDGDGEMDDVEVTLGTFYTIPQCGFEYEGHIFLGWNTEWDGEGRTYMPGQRVTFNTDEGWLTLYAQWQAKTHVYFDWGWGWGDGEMEDVYVMPGATYVIPECEFEYEGHVFAGWNTDLWGDGESYQPGQRVVFELEGDEDEVTLYAQWYSEVHVYFDWGTGWGEGEMEDAYVMPGETYVIPECEFDYEGFVFAGWNTELWGDGDTYMPGDSVVFLLEDGEEEITLYAQWLEMIQVSFDANDGDGAMEDVYVMPGEPFIVPECEFEYEWHNFLGWNTEWSGDGTSYQPGQSVMLDEEETYVILYAQWQEIYTTLVSFDGNGAYDGLMEDSLVASAVNFVLPANAFTLEGYLFVGWNTAPDGSGIAYADRATVNFHDEEITLYAQWELLPKICVLSFSANGGRGVMEPITLNEGESCVVPDCGFSCQGYHFVGWNTKADGSGISYTIGESISFDESDIILYAQWEKDIPVVSYTVFFDANGGEGTMSPMTVWSNQYYEMPECSFTREGYSFVGWCEVADGSEMIYLPGAKLNFTSDARFYAIWYSEMADGIEDVRDLSVNVYPNPVVGLLHIEGVTPTLVEVINLTGRVVNSVEYSATIDMSGLPNGVYMLRIFAPEGTLLRKVVKR